MKRNKTRQPRTRLLKASCVGAGLLSISNPTQVTAADIGVLDVHNDVSLGTVPNPFPSSSFGVHVAVGDLDGDGYADIVIGPGRGPSALAVVKGIHFSKVEMQLKTLSGGGGAGVSVATGDLDGDGKAEIITTPSSGSESTAAYIKLPDIDGEVEEYASFPNIFEGHSGGVNVATGDVDGDGLPDVLAGRLSCACGRPIKKWPGIFGLAAFEDFGPPVPSGQGGVRVAAGDVDGDGLDDYVVVPIAPTSGVSQPLLALADEKHKDWIEVLSFSEPAGVHIAMGDLTGDGLADLVVGSARGSEPYIKLYELAPDAVLPGVMHAKFFYEWVTYAPTFTGGVRVAVGDVTGDGHPDIAFAPAAIPEPATFASLLTGAGAWLLGWRRRRREEQPG
jgi:fibronectin-binding autotransporter adhesin